MQYLRDNDDRVANEIVRLKPKLGQEGQKDFAEGLKPRRRARPLKLTFN